MARRASERCEHQGTCNDVKCSIYSNHEKSNPSHRGSARATKGFSYMMFPDLLADDDGYEPVVLHTPKDGFTLEKKLSPEDELDARFETAEFLEAIGAKPEDEITKELAREAASKSFEDFVKNVPDPVKRDNLKNLKTPESVKRVVGMLSTYDWQFVEESQRIRGFIVTKLLEEAEDHPDAKVRLRALELLGKVTDVGLFSERIEVKKTDITDAELDAQIRAKLEKFIQKSETLALKPLEDKAIDGEFTEVHNA